MHPDVEPFAKEAAAKQKAWREAWQRLEESTARFMSTNVDSPAFYAISAEHSRIFNEWIKADRELHEAVRMMHEKALEATGIPSDHPLWALARRDPS